MKQLRFGILGTARIAHRQVKALQKAKNCTAVAIASRTANKARSFAMKYGLEAYEGYDRLLQDKSIDAVYLPLPNYLHKKWAIRCMEAGKHVVVDKPIVCTVDEIEELRDVSDVTGMKVMEGFMYRLHPVFDKLFGVIKENTIGTIRHVELEFCHNIEGYLNQEDNYRYYKEQGGGALFDLGSYGLDLFRYLLQNIVNGSVRFDVEYAYQQPFDLKQIPWAKSEMTAADESTHAVLTASHPDLMSSITCQLSVSFGFHRKKFWIGGDDGYLEIDHITSAGSKTIKIHQYSTGKDWIDTVEDKEDTDTYTRQFEQFTQAVHNDGDTFITLDDSLATVSLINRIMGF